MHDILKLKFIFSDYTPFFGRIPPCLFLFSSILSSIVLSVLCAAPQLFSIHKDFGGFMNALCSFPVRFPIYTWLAQGHIKKDSGWNTLEEGCNNFFIRIVSETVIYSFLLNPFFLSREMFQVVRHLWKSIIPSLFSMIFEDTVLFAVISQPFLCPPPLHMSLITFPSLPPLPLFFTSLGNKFSYCHACMLVAGVWCYAGVFAIGPLSGWGEYGAEPYGTACCINWHAPSQSSAAMSYIICLFFFCYIIPCTVIFLSYTFILLTVRGSRQAVQQHVSPQNKITNAHALIVKVNGFIYKSLQVKAIWRLYGINRVVDGSSMIGEVQFRPTLLKRLAVSGHCLLFCTY